MATSREKNLETQLETHKTLIAMVQSGIKHVMKNKEASASVLNALRLVELTTSVQEDPQAKKMKAEYVEPFIKQEEESQLEIVIQDTEEDSENRASQPAKPSLTSQNMYEGSQ